MPFLRVIINGEHISWSLILTDEDGKKKISLWEYFVLICLCSNHESWFPLVGTRVCTHWENVNIGWRVLSHDQAAPCWRKKKHPRKREFSAAHMFFEVFVFVVFTSSLTGWFICPFQMAWLPSGHFSRRSSVTRISSFGWPARSTKKSRAQPSLCRKPTRSLRSSLIFRHQERCVCVCVCSSFYSLMRPGKSLFLTSICSNWDILVYSYTDYDDQGQTKVEAYFSLKHCCFTKRKMVFFFSLVKKTLSLSTFHYFHTLQKSDEVCQKCT